MKHLILLVLSSLFVIGTASAADDAKTQFATFCVACHGDAGKGDGVAGGALDPKPSDLSVTKLSDDDLAKIIKEGGPAVGRSALMAPWGAVMDDAQLKAMVAFIRTLAPAK